MKLLARKLHQPFQPCIPAHACRFGEAIRFLKQVSTDSQVRALGGASTGAGRAPTGPWSLFRGCGGGVHACPVARYRMPARASATAARSNSGALAFCHLKKFKTAPSRVANRAWFQSSGGLAAVTLSAMLFSVQSQRPPSLKTSINDMSCASTSSRESVSISAGLHARNDLPGEAGFDLRPSSL